MNIRYLLYRLHQLFAYHCASGCIVVRLSGQATERPQVHVSACSRYGSQGVYSWYCDENGNAMATMYGASLASILNLPYHDQRTDAERKL